MSSALNNADTAQSAEDYYKLSYEDFVKGIEQLATIFDTQKHGGTISPIVSNSCFLHEWKINKDYHEPYLYHSSVLQRIFEETSVEEYASVHEEWIEEFEDDDNIVVDEDPDIATAPTVSTSGDAKDLNYKDIEWIFSIVYSHVWSMPILYFQVYRKDGRFIARKEVLKIINQSTNKDNHIPNGSNHKTGNKRNNDMDDQWNFLSQEEHPITGTASYFFHPCQTSSRMQLIFPQKESMKSNPGKFIMTWMSMILPAAGFRISPQLVQT